MGRAPCCDKANVKKGPWSPEEDTKLKEFIEKHGTGGNWIALPHKAGLRRCGKSCRLRWLNYLRPNIKHGEFSDDEDRIICSLFASIGSRWSIIATQLPGRTDNDIKNYWNTKLKKKLLGIPPSQRKPQQQQQLLFPSPSPSSQRSCYTTPRPLLSGFESFPATHHQDNFTDVPITTPTVLLPAQAQQYQMKEGCNILMFGGEKSCSSSDGSCTQIRYGQEMDLGGGGGGGGGGGDGEQMMGFESYPYVQGEKGNEVWEGAPLEYGYEEIKQLLSSNSLYVDDATPTGSSATGDCFRGQGWIMYPL